ncbi:MAG: helix-turn-helix domain-containing protein [Saprospiraceae bacterium]
MIRHRFVKGRSQEDVAREVGMSQSNYSKIESDKQDASPEQIECRYAGVYAVPDEGAGGVWPVRNTASPKLNTT